MQFLVKWKEKLQFRSHKAKTASQSVFEIKVHAYLDPEEANVEAFRYSGSRVPSDENPEKPKPETSIAKPPTRREGKGEIDVVTKLWHVIY